MILSLPAQGAIEATEVMADFEGPGVPAGFFVFNGGTDTVSPAAILASDAAPLARPGQVGDNGLLRIDYDVNGFGGFGTGFDLSGPQDWSRYSSLDFWFYGTGSGLVYQAEISDNRSDPLSDTSERFDYSFVDSTPGWQYISIPFEDFSRASDFQPAGAPDDGFTLTEIYAWAIVLPLGIDTVYFDDVSLGQRVIDDFESGLPSGFDGDGVPIGFYPFFDAASFIFAFTTGAPPAPLPTAAGVANSVLQVDLSVLSFAGIFHTFENETIDTWVPQDWSRHAGITFWLYGNNSGTELFVDVIENRNPGSTVDDGERWSVFFVDDFLGWQRLEFPFNSFSRKDIGNGAPDDGLSLQTVYGWAFGSLIGPPSTYYIDGVALYGAVELPPLLVSFETNLNDVDEGSTKAVSVTLNRPMTASDPAQVSVDFSSGIAGATATADRDYLPVDGTLTFVNGGPTELTFTIEALEDSKFEGSERFPMGLTNPIDVNLGFYTQSSAVILDNDPFDSTLIDDFEQGAFQWWADDDLALQALEFADSDPGARPGQDAFEHFLLVSTPIAVAPEFVIAGNFGRTGKFRNRGRGVVPVAILTTDSFDATTVDHTTVRFGNAAETHGSKKHGLVRHEKDFDGDGDLDLVFHFRLSETGYNPEEGVPILSGMTFDGIPFGSEVVSSFGRDFPIGQDWTQGEALRFWYFGTGGGDEITVRIKDNRAPDPGPTGWSLAWSDEFDDPAGTPPNPANWSHEIGNGDFGWNNSELQYYTDDPANASTDGLGNLAITLRDADGSLPCFYGPCEYTSARLISKHKKEFAYGRIESRIQVTSGEGIRSSFWGLGTDIDLVGWPQTGEIDFMDSVGRLPEEIFGTIHGPGYAGGASFGDIYYFGEPVSNNYHTFTIEWEPDLIRWYVDGILYHSAVPSDIGPNEWVFNDPVYFILNVTAGGNFGGALGPDLITPQSMLVDYVRVYQAPDTAERFETSFVDDFIGWHEVELPFELLTRSTMQPNGAPDDGLSLNEVWGYGFSLPAGGTSSGALLIDQVRLQLAP